MKSCLLSILVAATVLALAGSADAATIRATDDTGGDTVEQFVRKCKAVDVVQDRSKDLSGAAGFKGGFDFGQCVGYVSGVLEFHAIVRGVDPEAALFCLPARGISISEVIKLVTKYADEHPEDRQKSINAYLLGILITAFPCGEEPASNSDQN